MVGQLPVHLLLYLFHQAKIFPGNHSEGNHSLASYLALAYYFDHMIGMTCNMIIF